MTSKRTTIENFVIAVALIGITAYVLYNWFYPIAQYYLEDDWTVLPERIWFKGKIDWLEHLLFFNQTRFTCVGDYMLYRPGLFFWVWLQDIMGRSDRMAQQLLLVAVTCGIFISFYLMIFRECGKALALAGALFALTCLGGY